MDTPQGTVVMLSGPVGAGKTTVAQELVPLWPRPLSYVEGDKFWSFIAKSKSADPRENFRIIMRSMTAASLPFVRSGYDVLLDFSIPPEFLNTARVILKEVTLDYVLLKPSLATCQSRAANRTAGAIASYDAYLDFYAMFAYPDRHVIANDEAPAAAVAKRILEGLRDGLFRVA